MEVWIINEFGITFLSTPEARSQMKTSDSGKSLPNRSIITNVQHFYTFYTGLLVFFYLPDSPCIAATKEPTSQLGD